MKCRLYLHSFLQLKQMASLDNRGEGRGRVLLGRVLWSAGLCELQHDQQAY